MQVFNFLSVVVAYLLGSIPFGYLLVKYVFSQGQDIRQVGSGGTGATNVGRVAGVKGALLTYLLDVAKGAVAVVIAEHISHHDLRWMGIAAVMVIVGHIFPVWIGFRGGKGVATGLGVFLILSPFAVLSSLLLWGLVVYWKKYVSLGSIIAVAAIPAWILLWDGTVFAKPPEQVESLLGVAVVSCALIVMKHRDNIKRLIQGTENKIGSRSGQPARSQL
jgi:glycerol-3-phosphate acyltransferase PlsY